MAYAYTEIIFIFITWCDGDYEPEDMRNNPLNVLG